MCVKIDVFTSLVYKYKSIDTKLTIIHNIDENNSISKNDDNNLVVIVIKWYFFKYIFFLYKKR